MSAPSTARAPARRVVRPVEIETRGTPRPIPTPEGIELRFRVASAGDRLSAFALDALLMGIVIAALVWIVVAVVSSGGSGSWVLPFFFLTVFVVQNLYFIWFETRTSGQTPGKRKLGIRVMDAKGGPLTTDAVVVRNLMRNLEVYLPLAALGNPQAFWPGSPGWAQVLATLWMLLLAGLPLFNRWRLRPGDLVAGTQVVVAPRPMLLEDVVTHAAKTVRRREAARFEFTEAMLDAYGIYELQVLEGLLRSRSSGPKDHAKTMQAVADRIAKKIDWPERVPREEAHAFLAAYYAALRARLERRMLFGRRKEDKYDETA